MMKQVAAQFIERLQSFFLGSDLRRTSRVLVEQINTSLRLQPVSIACQVIGMAAIVARFWDAASHALLIVWALCVLTAVCLSNGLAHVGTGKTAASDMGLSRGFAP